MDHGQGQRAPGPCAIADCDYARRCARWGYAEDRPLSPVFVWDHCHHHDYVRGMLCREHNGDMQPLDARILGADRDAALMVHWLRCPRCEAARWEAWLTKGEHAGLGARRVLLAIGAAGELPSWWREDRRERHFRWLQERLAWL
jgi:hypothetical protein